MKTAIFLTILTCGVSLQAATLSTPQTMKDGVTSQSRFQTVAMGHFSEARALTSAYLILATGDRDYKGHRAKAMHQVETAAKLLGMDIRSEAKGHKPQALSDARLRDARGLLEKVLGAAEVKGQPRISKHITEAIHQINFALTIH